MKISMDSPLVSTTSRIRMMSYRDTIFETERKKKAELIRCVTTLKIIDQLRFSSSRYVKYKLTFFYVLKKNTYVNILSCNNKAEEVSKKDRDGNNQRNAE